jgi:hypothetical protein
MVKTRQKVGGSGSASPDMSPDSTSGRRQHLRKSHDGKAVKGFYRHAAMVASLQINQEDEEEPSTSEWKTSASSHHVSSVAAEAAKLVAPFVSITPTSPENCKSFSSSHSRGFHTDTLEVRPVAAPADFRASYLEPTSTTSAASGSERRKRRSNVLVPVEENSVLRRCLRRREREMWSKIGDMPEEEIEDFYGQSGPSVPKKRAFMKPLYSKKSCSASSGANFSETASTSSSSERHKKRPILMQSAKNLKRRLRRHEREMLSSDDSDDDIVDIDDSSSDEDDVNRPPGDRVAYIHVGEGGEADLEAQLKGAENLDIQILEEESLPDIDETDMIHGLDHTGTARDYVDERHRCTVNCPVGCQGHLRPNEIVIYESYKWRGKLLGRRR